MIEVLHTQHLPQRRWLENSWKIGFGVLLIAACLGLFAAFGSKKVEQNVDTWVTLQDLEMGRSVSKEKKRQAAGALEAQRACLGEWIPYFLHEPLLVEQALKGTTSRFSDATRLIARTKYKEALNIAEKIQTELESPLLKGINLYRILALRHQLKLPLNETLNGLTSYEQTYPVEAKTLSDTYQIHNMDVKEFLMQEKDLLI